MKCKQYGRCSNFDDTECSGEDGSTPIACSHFSKIDLTTVPTPDLVRELCSRDGIEAHGISESYRVTIVHEIECLDPVEVFGPARIIVVRGEE